MIITTLIIPGQPKETSGDDGVLKSIPIAAVLTSAAPLGHQKPLFDRSRSTALSTAPDGHRRNSNQAIGKNPQYRFYPYENSRCT